MESAMPENPQPAKLASFAAVILDANLDKTLDYSVPEELAPLAKPGARVDVTVKGFLRKGYIYKLHDRPETTKIQPLVCVYPEEAWITPKIFELGLFMAKYYAAPLSRVFKCMVPPSVRKEIKPKLTVFLTLKKSKAETLEHLPALREKSPLQAKVLDLLLNESKGAFLTDLAKAGLSKSAAAALVKKGLLCVQKLAPDAEYLLEEEYFPTRPKELTPEQKTALNAITDTLSKEAFATHLIHGITGSGKTEIYMQAMQNTLAMGKSAIVLVPEIALTTQAIERFKARFQNKIAILHHRRSLGERTQAFESIRKGEARIVIGARSAVFCPAQNLGLIIVDEEHDSSYKQSEESPAYHARDIAIMRGKLENACIVLGSATPSLETYSNALKGKYHLSALTARPGAAVIPSVEIVSMSAEFGKAGGFTHFSEPLLNGIKKRHEKGEQTLLFLNRRGYHSAQLCASCSHIVECPHCDTSLTYHRNNEILRCHLCDFAMPPLRACPKCSSATIQYKGFGTEHVEKSLHAILPGIRTLRMDRDTTTGKHSHEELIGQFRTGKADVLIGTQMIAKGLHFPAVTLVGILNADAALSLPDFRASENVFQLITQVAGRAGRSDIKGEVIIQTFLPEHATIQLAAKQDYLSFYKQEIAMREQFGYPPFCRLAKLVFTGKDSEKTIQLAEEFRTALQKLLPSEYELYPVIPAGHAKVKDLFRFQFLVKGPKIPPVSEAIATIKKAFPFPSGIKLFADIDPLSTFF